MNDKETLQQAISLAIEGGWDPMSRNGNMKCSLDAVLHWTRNWDTERIIFNHEFAKALWGESILPMAADPEKLVRYEHWKHHLQNMVISPDPIAYLRDNMPVKEEVK